MSARGTRRLEEKSSAKGDVEEPTQSGTGEQEQGITKTETNTSIAETFSLLHEIIFVTVICLAQLFTHTKEAALGQVISITRVIGDSFGITNPGELSWLIAGYSLTVGTFIIFSGRLGDVFGYKTMYLLGMAWFSLWSLVAGLAVYSNHVLFIFARVLQGVGPAVVLPNSLAILGSTYAPGKRKAMVFAIFGATAPGGAILGAAFSGLFALEGWPWTFWCFSIVLAAVVVIGFFAIPSRVQIHRQQRARGFRHLVLEELDMPGTITGVAALVLINLAWNQAPIAGWSQPYVYITLILGILILGVFFFIEIRYATHPLIPFNTLSSDVSFTLGAIACGWGCFGIWIYYSWQFLLVLRTESPLLATAHFSPVAISGAVAAILTGALMHRMGPPLVMLCALLAFTVGAVLIATMPVGQTYWAQTFVATLIAPFGMDMSFPAATLILSDAMPRRHQGIAASLVSTVVNYSISIALGFAGTVDVNVNNGGLTKADVLKGYRGGLYMAISLAGFGVAICVAFLVKTNTQRKKLVMNQGKPEA
ncbi:hypothetical protein DL765_007197 [Monosporascus sp. GIB2]|nr:hypothetical protein DL765_007197 [Monosporascus sp. GIB2]